MRTNLLIPILFDVLAFGACMRGPEHCVPMGTCVTWTTKATPGHPRVCVRGPFERVACRQFDMDGDGDVDLRDWSVWTRRDDEGEPD